MEITSLDEIARALADGLRESLCSYEARVLPQLLRLLAEGRAVSPEQIATALHIPRNDVSAALRSLPNVEFNDDGNVVGSGLTLTETPHRFEVSGHELFTWCALDTLFIPGILGLPARVESTCPATGVKVRLTVTPEGVERLEPAGAVVSIVTPDASKACCDIRGAFCNQVHFFSCSEAASTWLTERQGGIILSVLDAYQVGRILTRYLFEESLEV